ncbi:Localization factor PodJS [Phenylobacterium hankyongense]|uniref:Localization factor PodJS n=1 Tax=Phenylobacterium hankyongense TaxID=1813876 RepID=A0A328AUY4_9CAUL|nr:peptidoglycan-binding protein [Phenylobacterium hankyongense]RAK58830.1 Localization factor PodJS [Phenylobacterium hankyongense]
MTAGAPWSVKGIDPKAREVAKDLARRAGMTLGEWLNRVILEDDLPEDVTSEDHFAERPQRAFVEPPRPRLVSLTPAPRGDDLARIAYALDRLTDRIEASETRTGLAISGVEHSVRQAVARIETTEREHVAVSARFESAVDRVASEQTRVAERLRRMESEAAGPRSAEALRALEQSVTRVAGHVYDAEGRTRETLAALEARLQRTEAFAGGDPAALIDEVMGRLGQRLADAEGRTADALDSLRSSLGTLDGRLRSVETGAPADVEHRLETLAASLTQRVEDARAEIAEKLSATGAGRVDQRFAELAAHVQAAEQRSADAIQRMGHEVLSMAETLNRRVQTSEQRSAEAIAQVGGEMARVAGAVETRLGRAEQVQAEALEKLGAEIGRITERLTERMLGSERRAAQAIDDVGEQVARVTERMEQRHERASDDLAERIRQSEERTALLLDDARSRIEQRLAEPQTRPTLDVLAAPSAAAFGPELFSRAETEAEDEFADDLAPEAHVQADAYAEPAGFARADFDSADFHRADFDADEDFAPIPEPEEDLFGLDQPEPPAEAEADAQPFSTREVIEQARAAARAAATAEPTKPPLEAKIKARWRTTGKASPGLFGGLKSRRAPNSTLQTALMVAGGAAFLSVGAAGVVLMEGPPSPHSADALVVGSIHSSPRAAIALSPQALGPVTPVPMEAPEVAAPPPPPPPADALVTAYVNAVKGVEAGQPGALAKLKAIADAGHPPAEAYLGKLYETGAHGVTLNMAEARRWTLRAAEGGDAAAMHNTALYYFRGEGGSQDLANAVRWFRKAADQGVVDSQYNLGLLYQTGSGVGRDLGEAYKWFSIAANGGDSQARANALDLEPKLPAAQLAAADQAVDAFRPAGDRSALAARTAPPAATVATAQRILGHLGYYKGPVDGAATSKLKLAVAAYQRDQGLAATGSLDPNTASRLSVFTR